jgi:hypothetical protein
MRSQIDGKYIRKYVRTDWDYVKHLMALVDCGNRNPKCYIYDMERRTMTVAFMYDNYGFCSTMFVSLNGSPPKAYAVLRTPDLEKFELRKVNGEVKAYYEFSGFEDEIEIGELVVLDIGLSVREPYEIDPETWRPVLKLDLKEAFSRDDIIVMNTEVLPLRIQRLREMGIDVIGWASLSKNGKLKTRGVKGVKVEDGYIIYNNRKYPPGLYYLIRAKGMKFLVDSGFFESAVYDDPDEGSKG